MTGAWWCRAALCSGVRGSVLGGVIAVGLSLGLAPAAYADCAERPAPSAHAFEGTVIATDDGGRTATVVTENGDQVTVENPAADGVSSSDRRFAVGALYEFHPTNATSPYRDNGCTATRRLWGPRPAPIEPGQGFLPAWLPVDDHAGAAGYALVLAPVVLAVLAIGVGFGMTRRKGAAGPPDVQRESSS
ncbi:hypothetical protein ABN028_32315 [Actinopolymorpha sp. B17G11]|uniref:hypothetical protein n=1 Tax=Actinopolymorpha sp. B17G11 TaxID=3160861 RepID=UPI0032E44429